MGKHKIIVQEHEITIVTEQHADYISLTDIAKYRNRYEPFSIINNWMRNRGTIEFLGLWERLNNPDFKPVEFERFRIEAGSNYFVLSNLESINALLIRQELSQFERITKLNETAISQMRSLVDHKQIKKLKE